MGLCNAWVELRQVRDSQRSCHKVQPRIWFVCRRGFFTMSHLTFTRISIDIRMVLSKSIDFFSSDFDFDVTRALLLLWNLNVLRLEVATEASLSFRAQLCNLHDFQVKQQDEWSMDFFIEHASKGTDDMRLTLKKMLRTGHQRYHMQLRHLCSIQKRYLLSQASYDFSKVDSIFYNLLSVNRWFWAYLPWSSSIYPAHPRPLVSWCRLSYWIFFVVETLKMDGHRQSAWYTLQGINISHLGKRKIIFKMPFLGDMLVPWRVCDSSLFSMEVSEYTWGDERILVCMLLIDKYS